MPSLREGGLAQCQEDELWPPQVFAIAAAWMDEGLRRGGRVPCRRGGVSQGRDQEGRRWILLGRAGRLCIYRV